MSGPPLRARSFWRRWPALAGMALLAGLAACAVLVAMLNRWGEAPLPQDDGPPGPATPQAIARGEYLARAGNCMACHTEPGGAPFAGGRGIETPFGTVYSTNLTPDPDTGLGRWSDAAFWRALHHGRSRDGRLLYPAFPYPSYTHVTREDADAIHAYLHSLPPVRQAARPHALGFPYGTQAALAVWRALFFRPGGLAPEPDRPADWNRGRYLVQGLGHCAACHSPRNALGATRDAGALRGGLIPVQNWYAPALDTVREAGVADWPVDEVVALLRDGTAPRGTVTGPMAEVVFRSTQYLDDADLRAIATYLRALPAPEGPAPAASPPPSRPVMERGGRSMPATARSATATAGRADRGIPSTGRQPRGAARIAGERGAHHPPGRLSSGDARESAAPRHAALHPGAGRRRRGRRGHFRAQRLGQPRARGGYHRRVPSTGAPGALSRPPSLPVLRPLRLFFQAC